MRSAARSKKRGIGNRPAGGDHHAAKLAEESVRELRRLHQNGICIKCAIAFLKLCISYQSAWDAVNYATWRHVRD